jgi:peptide/nickel transport system substrate-binding protein
VAAALDVEAVNEAVFQGVGQVADTLFAQPSPFYSDTPLHRPDRATAQRLFDELAAEGKPVEFTFTTFSSSEVQAIAEAVQAQLSAFRNVRVEVSVIDLAQAGTLQTTHDFDATITSAFFTDPDPRLWTQFNGGSSNNMSGIDDPALNEALQRGRLGTSVDQRRADYDVVQQRLGELTPVVFLMRIAPGVVSGRDVGGLAQYGSGSLLPEELWVQE